jgi:hypothetical protein
MDCLDRRTAHQDAMTAKKQARDGFAKALQPDNAADSNAPASHCQPGRAETTDQDEKLRLM